MSGDGVSFIGTAIKPQGRQEALVAVVPEPAALPVLVPAAVSMRRGRWSP